MSDILFDFNNMFSSSVGSTHGVEEREVEALSAACEQAHRHLESVLGDRNTRIALSLEWTQLPLQDDTTLAGIESMARAVREGFDNVLFLGIGGSYLGLKAAQDALAQPYYNDFPAVRSGYPRVYFEGNNLDPDTLSTLLERLDPKKTSVVVISKSGETTETKAAFCTVASWLKESVGPVYGRQVFAVTDPSTGSLRRMVDEAQGSDDQSFRNLPLLAGVGGRFSEFNMGLLHLAVIGVSIRDVLAGAREMSRRCFGPDVRRNPALMYAALHTILYRQKNKPVAVLMPFSETLRSTADWYIQLLAESLGKKFGRTIRRDGPTERWEHDTGRVMHVGRTPIATRGTSDLHSVQQNHVEGENNKVITFIRVERFRKELSVGPDGGLLAGKKFSELMGIAQEATEWALVREERPNCTIRLPQVTPAHWGGLLYFFEMATAYEGELLDVNAFDQPGVEGYKQYMYYKLGKEGLRDDVTREIRNNPLRKDEKYIL
jgi:glucose-6-phosphate isomerase